MMVTMMICFVFSFPALLPPQMNDDGFSTVKSKRKPKPKLKRPENFPMDTLQVKTSQPELLRWMESLLEHDKNFGVKLYKTGSCVQFMWYPSEENTLRYSKGMLVTVGGWQRYCMVQN